MKELIKQKLEQYEIERSELWAIVFGDACGTEHVKYALIRMELINRTIKDFKELLAVAEPVKDPDSEYAELLLQSMKDLNKKLEPINKALSTKILTGVRLQAKDLEYKPQPENVSRVFISHSGTEM